MSKLLFLILASLVLTNCQEAPEFYRAFHIDCGRKYFTMLQIKDMIDVMAKNNYNLLELAIGNEGMRFMLDDMTLEVGEETYESKDVQKALNKGNKNYYDAGKANELTEEEMDSIIEYAKKNGITVFPLVNSPGHMSAILDACTELLGEDCSYHKSTTTIDMTKEKVVAFVYAFIAKYMRYFKEKGSPLFNLGGDEYANDVYTDGSMGFGNLIKEGKYKDFIIYVNGLAEMIKGEGMVPVAFNDGFYFSGVTDAGELDKDIIVSYWSTGWGEYSLYPAENLAEMGYKILNTHFDWYYVLNWEAISGGSTTFKNTLKGIASYPYNYVIGSGEMEVVGAMVCYWCDRPSYEYDATEEGYLKRQIQEFADANPGIFEE